MKTILLKFRRFFITLLLCLLAMASEGCSQGERRLSKSTLNDIREKALQGDAIEQYKLAILLYEGRGIQQDFTESANWSRKAAEHGLKEAQWLLGTLYYRGEGLPQDYHKAFEWFQMSAAQGDINAQFFMGICYSQGQGVALDAINGYAWLNLSTLNHQPHAPELRDIYAEEMTTEQIVAGRRLSRQWYENSKWYENSRSAG